MGPLGGALENLASPDKTYVVTRPGEALQVGFDVGAVPDREKLRLPSRFPQGLSGPLLEALLAAEGQTAVEVIGGK